MVNCIKIFVPAKERRKFTKKCNENLIFLKNFGFAFRFVTCEVKKGKNNQNLRNQNLGFEKKDVSGDPNLLQK